MSAISRRQVIKLAAGLGVAPAAAAAGPGEAQVPKQPDGRQQTRPGTDALLAQAMQDPQTFMLTGPVTFHLGAGHESYDLFITSARDVDRNRYLVHVPSRSIRIFRADAEMDSFTGQGGLYWRFRDRQGKVKLASPGEIVMVMRDGDDTVRCYIMTPDFRC